MGTIQSDDFIISRIGKGTARLVEPKYRMKISNIPTSWLVKQLKEAGTLIFRDFEIDRCSLFA